MRRILFLILALLLVAALSVLILVVLMVTRPETRPPLTFSPDQLPAAQLGQPYSVTVTISGNVTPVGSMSIGDGTLPRGLVLHHTRSNSTAEISGIPEETGIFKFAVSAWCFGTNVSGQTGQQAYSLMVK